MPFQKLSTASSLLLVTIAFAGLTGCGEGDRLDQPNSNQCSGSSAGDSTRTNGLSVEVGQLMTPERVVFASPALGVVSVQMVELQNVGSGRLIVTDAELSEERGGALDGHREFSRGESGWIDEPVAIEPGETFELAIQYRPVNQGVDRGQITLTTACASQTTHEVSLEAPAAEPDIYAPSPLNFGRVPPQNDPAWQGEHRLLPIENLGGAPLSIEDIYITGSDRFSISFPQPTESELDTDTPPNPEGDLDHAPETLAHGDMFWVRVWFRPDDNLPETAELVFETNDPDESRYIVAINEYTPEPCIQVSPRDQLDFGVNSLGEISQKTITVENCSRSAELEVRDIQITDDGSGVFAIQGGSLPGGLPADEAVIAPRERAQFVVTFTPTAEEMYEGEVTILSDDTVTSPTRIPILGRGSDNICPTAVAKAWVQGSTRKSTTVETSPLNTILFDGSESSDPDGSVVEYEWTILTQPQGSTQRMLPDSSSDSPRIFLDLAGTYEVELRVKDDDGAYNCGERAIVTIIAGGTGDVHIQLVWSTPNDSDETDTDGTNLDLHYLHPDGDWNEAPGAIFWQNPTADWGVLGDSTDDPMLDIDDTDGVGPENITHEKPANVTYRTGVYYRSDEGFGESYATVRVYLRGTLALELDNQYLAHEGKFWDVATIDWANQTVSEVDVVYDGFPAP